MSKPSQSSLHEKIETTIYQITTLMLARDFLQARLHFGSLKPHFDQLALDDPMRLKVSSIGSLLTPQIPTARKRPTFRQSLFNL